MRKLVEEMRASGNTQQTLGALCREISNVTWCGGCLSKDTQKWATKTLS